MRYTNDMQLVVFVVLAIVVALVAIDAIGRLDEKRTPKQKPRDQSVISTQKIVVDLSKRR